MTHPVLDGAPLRCSSGRAPGRLRVPGSRQVSIAGQPVAVVSDHLPLVHVMSFEVCVAGSPPRCCVPRTPSAWRPGATTVTLAGEALLDTTSSLLCAMGGVITPAPAADPGVALP